MQSSQMWISQLASQLSVLLEVHVLKPYLPCSTCSGSVAAEVADLCVISRATAAAHGGLHAAVAKLLNLLHTTSACKRCCHGIGGLVCK